MRRRRISPSRLPPSQARPLRRRSSLCLLDAGYPVSTRTRGARTETRGAALLPGSLAALPAAVRELAEETGLPCAIFIRPPVTTPAERPHVTVFDDWDDSRGVPVAAARLGAWAGAQTAPPASAEAVVAAAEGMSAAEQEQWEAQLQRVGDALCGRVGKCRLESSLPLLLERRRPSPEVVEAAARAQRSTAKGAIIVEEREGRDDDEDDDEEYEGEL